MVWLGKGETLMMDGGNSKQRPPRRMLVAQIGARMHYAIPRIFHEAGILGAFHTDVVSNKGWPGIVGRMIPPSLRVAAIKRLLARVPHGVPKSLIRTENDLGIKFAMQFRKAKNATEETAAHLWAGKNFCERVVQRGMEPFDGVYVFSVDGLEILERAKELGIKSYVEQTVAPHDTYAAVMEEERRRFPDLVDSNAIDLRWQELAEREHREWELADTIVCGSAYVRDSIREVAGNAAADKGIIVSYGVDEKLMATSAPRKRPGKIFNVLFVGQVGFRKGCHYLIEAARRLPKDFHFRFCGNVTLPPSYLNQLPSNVELLGIVPRNEMPNQYAWADVFCLPSLLEGSATVTYEAMAAGVPVITTPQSGSIVRDQIDGMIIPAGDVDAIVEALQRAREEGFPEDRPVMRDRPGGPPSFTLAAYQERLLNLVLGERNLVAGGECVT